VHAVSLRRERKPRAVWLHRQRLPRPTSSRWRSRRISARAPVGFAPHRRSSGRPAVLGACETQAP